MKTISILFATLLAGCASITNTTTNTTPPNPAPVLASHASEVAAWRDKIATSLARDNGWLTLAGRFPMKAGANTFGTGADNDLFFPPELAGTDPARLGTITVAPNGGGVVLKLADGVAMKSGATAFTGTRELGTSTENRDWVTLGRIAMHVIAREGRYILRLADNESLVRKNFAGRIWYPTDPKFLVDAKYVPYPPGKKIAIVNVIDEVSDEVAPGYVEFTLNGQVQRLDAVGDDAGLFFVIRDGTAGDTTYRPSRFLYVEKKPEPNTPFKLDFNRAYNPPCAFSEFTTCPLPPPQNIMKTRIEAGEKYRKVG